MAKSLTNCTKFPHFKMKYDLSFAWKVIFGSVLNHLSLELVTQIVPSLQCIKVFVCCCNSAEMNSQIPHLV